MVNMERLWLRFRSQQFFLKARYTEDFFPKFIAICMEKPWAGAHPDRYQHGARKPTEQSVTEFCYESVNLSLEELKNIKIILFLIHELLR